MKIGDKLLLLTTKEVIMLLVIAGILAALWLLDICRAPAGRPWRTGDRRSAGKGLGGIDGGASLGDGARTGSSVFYR